MKSIPHSYTKKKKNINFVEYVYKKIFVHFIVFKLTPTPTPQKTRKKLKPKSECMHIKQLTIVFILLYLAAFEPPPSPQKKQKKEMKEKNKQKTKKYQNKKKHGKRNNKISFIILQLLPNILKHLTFC